MAGWKGLLLAILPFWTACSRIENPVVDPSLAARCTVMGPVDPESDASGWAEWLGRHLPGAQFHDWSNPAQVATEALTGDRLLVIAAADRMPAAARDAMGEYLLAGGRLLVLGLDHPFLDTEHKDIRTACGMNVPLITVTGGTIQVEGLAEPVALDPRPMVGTYPGPRGTGGERAGEIRWIPLARAIQSDGVTMAWPGAVWLTPQDHGRYGVSGWLGFNLHREDGRILLPAVSAVLQSMTRDVYLLRYGLAEHSIKGRTPHVAMAQLVDRRLKDASPLRLAVEWINERDQQVRRHVSPPLDALASQATINIGLAPHPAAETERYSLRFVVRDRQDQVDLDVAEQAITVFSAEPGAPHGDPITINAGQLVQGRRPMFMLGVNYWPRLSVPLMDTAHHWLHTAWFDPEVVESDLDLMAAVGINALSMEYTDIEQAPQVRFVLDELRKRSMWACLYVPALHPLDLRMDDAAAMLKAIELERWPEVFAIEIARGFSVPPRVERRRLDPAWKNWVEENFSSTEEAELKLGISLWRDRGGLTGPPDLEVRRGPDQERAVALYYCFLRDYISRRTGYIQQWKNAAGYRTLLTARSAYGWPMDAPSDTLDVLDISTAALHLDVMFPDAWSVHPLRSMPGDGDVLAAYVRGAGAGKPVLWSSFGQPASGQQAAGAEQRQKEVFSTYLGMFIKQEASGAFAWWYPPGTAGPVQADWGLVSPAGHWRPVEESLRTARLQIRQLRMQPRPVVRQPGPLVLSAAQWNARQRDRTGLFADNTDRSVNPVTEWVPAGTGSDSLALLDPRLRGKWSELDAFTLLNAEWTSVTVGEAPFDREPDTQVRTYTGRSLRLEVLNSGTIRWVGSADRSNGHVWIRISHAGRQDEWISLEDLERGSRKAISWIPREPGVWELQPYLIGYGSFGEKLRVEVSTPPRLF